MGSGVLGSVLLSWLAATASTTAIPSFRVEIDGHPVRLVLQRIAPPTSDGFEVLRRGRDGTLRRTSVAVPDCLFTAVVYEDGSASPLAGAFASVSTCIHTAGRTGETTLHGMIGAFDRLWSITPVPGGGSNPHRVVSMDALRQHPTSAPGVVVAVERAATTVDFVLPFREGTPEETKYIEALAVSDEARIAEQGGEAQAVADTIAAIANMNALMAASGLSPRARLVLTDQILFEDDPFTPQVAGGEVSETELLGLFNNWAVSEDDLPEHDLHVLLTGFDLSGNVVGVAPVAGMCSGNRSGLVVQGTQNLQALAGLVGVHEIGHSLSMGHDGDNGCPGAGFIMSPTADPRLMNPQFSTCSLDDYGNYLDSGAADCLINLPRDVVAQTCGDGVVSGDETCDCGESDCAEIDPCCDGETCRLAPGATCSEYSDECCQACQIPSREDDVECRAAQGACDLPEFCSGTSSRCPGDFFEPVGSTCTDEAGNEGACYAADCRSRQTQCEDLGEQFDIPFTGPDDPCLEGNDPCGSPRCQNRDNGACFNIQGASVSNGVPCDTDSLCEGGDCIPVVDIDGCPNDADKTTQGQCGCGEPDTDRDDDGTADCIDLCPDDPALTDPGPCGCGVPATDSDFDGTLDCVDACPEDASKAEPGACGCGTPDVDSDSDGAFDCADPCPTDPVDQCAPPAVADDGGATSGGGMTGGSGATSPGLDDTDVLAVSAGCSCRASSDERSRGWLWLAAIVMVRLGRRRRR